MTILHKGKRHHYFTLTTLRKVGTQEIIEEVAGADIWNDRVFHQPLIWLIDAMRVTYTDPAIYFEVRPNKTISVMQAGLHMGTFGVFRPSGMVRDTLQAEVSSRRIRNKKSPSDVKRSSTRPKAEKLVELLDYKTPEAYAEAQGQETESNFNRIVSKSAPVDDRFLTEFMQGLYYNSSYDMVSRMMRGETTGADQQEIHKYLAAYDKVQDQRMEQALLRDLWVTLQELPPGGPSLYRMVIHHRTFTGGTGTTDKVDRTIRDFPSIDALPDVIQSKLALLQLGTGDDAKMVGFRHEADCDWLTRYGFIGEDLGELLDTGRESKEGGDSLP
jgi:hypothetical protein